MILGYDGKQGGGKTLLMVRYGYNNFESYDNLYSNVHLTKIKYKPMDKDFFDKVAKLDIKNSLILWDEIQEYINSRTFKTKFNLDAGTFIRQVRKGNNTLVWTSQFIFQVDKVLRYNSDMFITCTSNFEGVHPSKVDLDKLKIVYEIKEPSTYGELNVIATKVLNNCRQWGEAYDTTQSITRHIDTQYDELRFFLNNLAYELPLSYKARFKPEVHHDLVRFAKSVRAEVYKIMKLKK